MLTILEIQLIVQWIQEWAQLTYYYLNHFHLLN